MSDAMLLELSRRVAELERRMAALEGGGGATEPAAPVPGPESDPELRDLLARGNTIGAIKRYRELTGLGLAEAKDAVESIAAGYQLR